MANLLTSCELPVAVGEKPASAVSRRAFYLPSQGKPVFAWLHQGAQRLGHGVLLCAPAGHEQVHAHRTLRHLAERLAEAGFDAVRFDYHNAGDSADLDAGENTYAAWLGNIRDVIDWMRDELGCSAISLFGLRFGATLAVQIAAEQTIDSLMLWEPVVRGRGYGRELKALAMMEGAPPVASGDVEAAGFVFGRQFLEEIGRIDLLKVALKCRRALLLSRDDLPVDGKLLQHLRGLGIDAEQYSLRSYAAMLAEPHFAKVPDEAIARTVAWLGSRQGDTETRRQGVKETPSTAVSLSPCLPVSLSPCLRERIVQISQTPALFGILSEPDQLSDLPLIVMSNAGSAYHVGPGRLHVQLARRLAACGFRCLRIDIAGLGDSDADDSARETDCYTPTALRDIELTLQFAQGQLGAKRAIVMGLCSGAYFAFQAAAQSAEPALVESILINPLAFFWKDGMTIENSPAFEHAALQYYQSSALQPSKWLKLLRGQTKIGVLGALKILVRRALHWHEAKPLVGVKGNGLGHPAVDDLPGDLERVQKNGRQLACFFARSDPGYTLLMFKASRTVKQLCRAGKMSVHFIENADHTFSRQGPRQAFVDAVAAYLCKRYTH